MAQYSKMPERIKTVHKCRKVHVSQYLYIYILSFLYKRYRNNVKYALVH
jgi:hypothetical protein